MNIFTDNDSLFKAAAFVINKLGIFESDYVEEIHVDIENLETGFFGFMENFDGNVFITLSDELSGEDLIRTVLHETIHAVQIARGDLRFEGRRKFWKGQEVKVEYNDEPWEIEAYKLEDELYKEYASGN